MIKVSFLGDFLCEGPFFRAGKQGDSYDYRAAFDGIRDKCAQSDLLIGNLETPLAGAKMGYVSDRFTVYSMNAPVEYAQAVKDLGVDMVLTANNHCYDRGEQGLINTLDALDSIGLGHTGTFRNASEGRVGYLNCDGTRIAVIACTASTNEKDTGLEPGPDHMNLLKTQAKRRKYRDLKGWLRAVKRWAGVHVIGSRRLFELKRRLGMTYNAPRADDVIHREDVDRHLDRLKGWIEEAKTNADLVFVCPHMGGQFNAEPGAFSRYVMDYLSHNGADAVIALHPHVIQKAEVQNGSVPCFFCLGNVAMSMSTVYMIKVNQPDYGLMVHFYIEDKRIRRVTGSLLKMHDDAQGLVHVDMLHDLYEAADANERKGLLADAEQIMRRLRPAHDAPLETIEDEFELFDF